MISTKTDYTAFTIFDDPMFKFDEDSHKYTYCNEKTGKTIQKFTSVTSFIDQFKESFDSEYWAKKKAKERGITKKAILLEWKEKRDTSAALGTTIHKWIEDFYSNSKPPKIPKDENLVKRIEKFKNLHDKRLHKLTPIFQEKRVFSRKWGLAGTLDGLFEFNDIPRIGDWKTNKEFLTDDDFKGRFKKLLYPFEDLYDNSLNAYSIQVSLYRLIIEEETGIDLGDGFIGWIGPNEVKLYKVLDLRDRLLNFLNKNNLSI